MFDILYNGISFETEVRGRTHVKLAGAEERSCSNQLEPLSLRASLAEVQVDQLDCEVQRLMVQLKVLLDLHQPVHQHRPHARGQV